MDTPEFIIIAVFCLFGSLSAFVLIDNYLVSGLLTGTLFISAMALIFHCITDSDLIRKREIENDISQYQITQCSKPKLVAVEGDAKLYSIDPGCRGTLVYFSASGTQTEKCRLVHTGKSTRRVCEDVFVPNTINTKEK